MDSDRIRRCTCREVVPSVEGEGIARVQRVFFAVVQDDG